jgi:type IV pilus assembly protein PilV
MKQSPHRRTPLRGMSLIEVLVGILLISFGLLGLISLLGRTLQFSVGAEDSQRAALLASEMAASILTSNTSTSGALVIDGGALAAWQAMVASPTTRGLPNGNGTVAPAGRTARITVQWQPPQAASGVMNTYVTDVVLP